MTNEAIVLVGIDVGMTCTGVAWAVQNRSIHMTDPHVIQKWPGNAGAQSDKVPTVVAYSNGMLTSWGFLATQAVEDITNPQEAYEWFKIYFDEQEYERLRKLDASRLPGSHEEVRMWYRDYLRRLGGEIERQLEGRIGSAWHLATIEFLFSVPTTWTALSILTDFESLIGEAGFGRGGARHSYNVTLTEAEAAAVHTFKAGAISYSDGDIILIVDAGGGTTDLALLEAHAKDGERPSLRQLDVVRGDEIGSVLIDLSFKDLAEQRLKSIERRLRKPAEDIAWEMMRTSFPAFKVEFGTEHSNYQNIKLMNVPGLGDDFDAPEVGIMRGRMRFTNADIQAIFDEQIVKIFELVDHQIARMAKVADGKQITYMILSGGLGSSEYLKQKLKWRYTGNASSHLSAKNMGIVTSDAPQLAVVKGLVQDRIQRLETGPGEPDTGVLVARVCRMSLGVICSQKYDPKIHRGQEILIDPVDRKKYVRRRIVWFITQGQSVSEEAITRQFFRTIDKDGSTNRSAWVSEVAISYDIDSLPVSMQEGGAKTLCQIKSDLTSVPITDFEKRRRSWWQFWKSYRTHYIATYNVKFRMKPAGLDFELWYKGQKFANTLLKVDWEDGAKLASPKDHRRPTLDHARHI